jgi:hypothetical protein
MKEFKGDSEGNITYEDLKAVLATWLQKSTEHGAKKQTSFKTHYGIGAKMNSWSRIFTETLRRVYSIWVDKPKAQGSATPPSTGGGGSSGGGGGWGLLLANLSDDSPESLETRAVKKIQRLVAAKHASKQGNTLGRKPLVERLQLDLDLIRGLRLLFFCALMFGLVIYAANLEKRSAQRLGLLNTFSTIFSLNADTLYEIKTPENFFDYLRMVSEQSRLLQAGLLKSTL